jgi:hypothetical protein
MWPDLFYQMDEEDWNPFRKVLHVDLPPEYKEVSELPDDDYRATTRSEYFSRMSEILAEFCSGTATVMTEDLDAIPTGGIWFHREAPRLTSDTPLPDHQVDLVNESTNLSGIKD